MNVADRPANGANAQLFSPRLRQMHWYEAAIIGLVVLALIVYLPIVINRSAVHGFGDVQVFFRAGWAIWTGYPLYEVADHHGWTYHYPPTFALLMGPFANPLDGYARPSWALSFSASVAAWYVISAVAMLLALDLWARGLQRHVPPLDQRAWNGWWLLRLGPLLALMPFLGDGLGRGQPTAVLLLSMVAFLVFYVQGRWVAAACCLAVGITIKIFPVALLLIPLLRRDVKTLAATAGFSLFFLIVVPMLCLGPTAVVQLYSALWSDHLTGILGGAPNPKIAAEITFTSYDMLSIAAMLTRIGAGGLPSSAVLPAWANAGQIVADLLIVGALILWGHGRFWRWRGPQPTPSKSLLIGGAILCAALPVMLSVSQPNYVAFAAPLLAAIQLEAWIRDKRVRLLPAMIVWSAIAWFGMIATDADVWKPLRVIGLVTPALMVLLAWALLRLQRRPARA